MNVAVSLLISLFLQTVCLGLMKDDVFFFGCFASLHMANPLTEEANRVKHFLLVGHSTSIVIYLFYQMCF